MYQLQMDDIGHRNWFLFDDLILWVASKDTLCQENQNISSL